MSGTPYQDPGADFYTRRESPEQKQAYLERQLQKLHPGCTVTITVSPPEWSVPAFMDTELGCQLTELPIS